jgi:hypothetical protein
VAWTDKVGLRGATKERLTYFAVMNFRRLSRLDCALGRVEESRRDSQTLLDLALPIDVRRSTRSGVKLVTSKVRERTLEM